MKAMTLNPYIAILIATTIGGTTGVLIKLLALPATSITFFRAAVPVIFMYILLRRRHTLLFHKNTGWVLTASALNAARLFLFFIGYLYTSVANGVIMLFTWPVFATVLSAIFLKERVSLKNASLIAIAFVGIIVMHLGQPFSFGNRDFIGMLSMLLSALLFAASTVIFKNELNRFSKTETIFYQNFLAAFIFLPFVFINHPWPTPIQLSGAVAYGLIGGVGAFGLFFYALKKLKMSHFSVITYWEIFTATGLGVLVFDEAITWHWYTGGSMILLSGILLRLQTEASPSR